MLDLNKLNPIQKEAVEITDGPLLILAGAGSGKTRVITYRIAYLVEQKKVSPSQIIAVTFTNKAAHEMKERIIKLIDYKAKGIWISTFHSASIRILRNHTDLLGFNRNFVIYADYEQDKILKEILMRLNLSEKDMPPFRLKSYISRAKNDLITADEYYKLNQNDYYTEKIGKVYLSYQQKLKENNAMDFDDLIMNTVLLLKNNTNIRDYYQELFRYILVDEYQDTNIAQYNLLRLLADKNKNICVVGDDDQSIYQWRGANINNILNFEHDFPGAKIIRMEQNYRSTSTILKAANNVIKHNKMRKGKKLWTENEEGEKIIHFMVDNEIAESRFVAETISNSTKDGNKKLSDFAIFYRTHAQSRILEDGLREKNIPYKIIGGIRFYDRKEIKDVMAYLSVICNTSDSINLQRIINIPKRGIGPATLLQINVFAEINKLSLFDALKRVNEIDGLSPRIKKTISEFISLIEEYIQLKDTTFASALIKSLLDRINYYKGFEDEEDGEARIQNVQELISAAYEYEESSSNGLLPEFLEKISLAANIDNLNNENSDYVVLMTLHNAKGLEFPMVFIVGIEEGIFPHSNSLFDENEMEEERRLCYVGITRAREKLFLITAEVRTLYGSMKFNPPSRFLREIPLELIANFSSADNNAENTSYIKNSKNTPPDNFAISDETPEQEVFNNKNKLKTTFKVGQLVRHKKWGVGKIKNIYGKDENTKIELVFKNFGEKKLALEYAELETV